jgi:hypothetical protein
LAVCPQLAGSAALTFVIVRWQRYFIVLRAFYEARRNQSADVVDGVKGVKPPGSSTRGSNARVEQAPGEASKEQRRASWKKAYAAKKRRAAKQATKAPVAKRTA